MPIQVDQRHLEFLSKLRNGTGTTGPEGARLLRSRRQRRAPIRSSTFDADDEMAFMAVDTGGEATGSDRPPPG